MKINRTELLSSLTDFVNLNSGVVIGIPGVGKSHILAELVIALTEKKIPACLLKLDNLTNGSDEEIANALGMTDSVWIDNLKAIPSPSVGRPTFVFDAFDTLRDEKLKEIMLFKIAQVKQALPDWSVLVSVRTYDAHQSRKLIELFPSEFAQDGLDCRKFIIHELSEAELLRFLESNDKLHSLYNVANDRLKEIFKIPFYLKLLDFILSKEPEESNSLSVIKSEIELLDRYWSKVVADIKPMLATEIVLRKLTSEMINVKQLSANKYEFLGGLSQEEILIADRLLSENVLKEHGPAATQIAYSHNILFDYAVSKLIIQGSAKNIIQFIEEDGTRPLFLRPSFIYFFTRLWYQHRGEFWAVYSELTNQKTNDSIRLFNKLIPSAVVVREFEIADDIIWAKDNTEQHAHELIDILQGFRYLKPRASIAARAALLKKLSEKLNLLFLGDFCILLNSILGDEVIKTSKDAFADCGISSRNLFDFSIAHRGDQGINLEGIISIHAVPDIAKTFSTDQSESKKRLKEILATINTPGFNIGCISNITSEINGIYLHDPDFVVEIYKAVFEHQELEATETTMHQSTLLTLNSNRIDEFNLCRFRLREFFPTFLKAFPQLAIPLTIDLFQAFVHKRNSDGLIISDAYSIPLDMTVNGISTNYEVDLSHFWSSMTDHYDEIGLVNQMFTFFDTLIEQNETEQLKKLINIYFQNARSAYLWGRLLDWAARHAELLHAEIYELLLQPAILYWSDTVQQAGNFLENSLEWFNPDQLKKIEDSIAELGNYVAESEIGKTSATIFRLLSRIPKTKLQRDDTKALFEDKEPVANDDLVTYTTSSELYTTKMFLADEGVDVNDPLADKLLVAEQQLLGFTRSFDRHLPDADAYKDALKIAIDSYDEIKNNPNLPEKLVSAALVSIAGTCELVLRSDIHAKYVGEIRSTEYQKIKEIVLDCVSRHTSSDTYAEENYTVSGGFTSTPRSEGTSGLVNLYVLTNDESLIPAIKQFAVDKNAITRFNVNRFLGNLYTVNKELYWEIALERLANESDRMLWSTIVGSLDRKSIFDNESDKLLKALTIAQVNVKNVVKGSKFFENFLLTTLSFYRLKESPDAKELLLKSLRENILVTQSIIWSVLEIIQPENFYRNLFDQNDNDLSKRLIDLLFIILDDSDKILAAAAGDTEPTPEVDETFRILNQMVMRIYFSLQVNERLHQPGKGKYLISEQQQRAFYWMIKPVLERVMQISESIHVMQGYTAHYFIEILGLALDFDPEFALQCARKITELASATTYLRDMSAIQEIVRFTEKLLGNHRLLLADQTAFSHLKAILDIYATAGWPQALSLLWQLDEIFR